MRIYLPLTAQDRPVLQERGGSLDLSAERAAWAVGADAREDRPGQDEEDLEYEALQDAVYVALSAAAPAERALVIAADVADSAVDSATQDGGVFGISLRERVAARIASFHVTEQQAAAAQDDDTDPALLWFDASEGRDALAYLAAATTR